MEDEQLEEFIERLEKLFEDMSDRVAKLEDKINNPPNAPVGLSTPMVAYATRPSVGFRYPDSLPLRLEPQL